MTTPIHPLADIASSTIGDGTRIGQYTVVFERASIGRDCDFGSHCLIENDVVVGDRVAVRPGVKICDGVRLEDDVFIDTNACFTNRQYLPDQSVSNTNEKTIVERGASVGAGAIIFPRLRIGRNAMVAAGAIVSRSVPPNAIVAGNPAKIVGYVDAPRDADIPASRQDGKRLPTDVAGVTLHRLPRVTDMRGSLSVGEFERSIPFAAKRYFMVFDVPSVETRGEHAHRECHQFLICVRGSCAVVADDGKSRKEFVLNQPDVGLHLPPMVWGIQYKYSADAMLLVFASHYYDSVDYIRDYSEFTRLVGAKK